MRYKAVQINLTQLSKEVTTSQRKGYLILMLYQSTRLTSVKPSSNGGLVLPLDGKREVGFSVSVLSVRIRGSFFLNLKASG